MGDPKAPNVTPGGTVRMDASGEEAQTLVRDEGGPAPSGSHPRPVDPRPATLGGGEGIDRYSTDRLLGEGGMGEVRLCHDARVGRDVALKVIHPGRGSQGDARARFLREARVQGQLEHPSVVPVYDIGAGPGGEVFFTMKRIKGVTLAEILEGHRSGDAKTIERFGRRLLLSTLATVCQAVGFAHSRGVVHRDLKPANVMLGDFGEVYVLDWGVAKVGVAADEEAATLGPCDVPDTGDDLKTRAGALLGTPGYMAPEQVRGEDALVGPRSDVYSLGAMLFEILTLEPLHHGATLNDMLLSTLGTPMARPSERRPDAAVPPELDDLCARATCVDPVERLASACDFHCALTRFLDGEQDAERRRALAERHVAAAAEARGRAAAGGPEAEQHRARAMRELSAALAVEPTNTEALHGLLALLNDDHHELPPEAEAELAETNRRDRRGSAKAAALAYGCWWLGAPIMFWMGVKSWPLALAMDTLLLITVGYNAWMWRTGKTSPRFMRVSIPLGFVVVGHLSLLFGPFLIVPGAAVATATALMVGIRANRATAVFIAGCALAAVFLPAALELAGVLPPSYVFRGGGMVVQPYLVEWTSPVLALGLLALASAMIVLAGTVSVGRAVSVVVRAERRAFARAWRLRELLPEQAAAADAPDRT